MSRAAPWTFNPSSRGHRAPICLLALVGAAIASYLALYQLRVIPHVWDPVFGAQSERVLDSQLSQWLRSELGVPDAALGTAAYVLEFVFALVGGTRRWRRRPWLVALLGVNSAAMACAGILLVVMQATVVQAWCLLCLGSAAISLTLAGMAFPEVTASLHLLGDAWRDSHAAPAVWSTFLGRDSHTASDATRDGS